MSILQTFLQYRYLILQLFAQNLKQKYIDQKLGFAWIVLQPLFLAGVLYVVFTYIFKRGIVGWEDMLRSPNEYILALLAGLTAFGLIAEMAPRAVRLIILNAGLVTDMKFPLEVLPIALILEVLLGYVVKLLLLLSAILIMRQEVELTFLLAIPVALPLAVLSLGTAYFLAVAGLAFRDLDQVVNMFVTALLFLSGVIYPLTRLADYATLLVWLNPVALTIRELRVVTLQGGMPDWGMLLFVLAEGLVMCALGWWVFRRYQNRFVNAL